METKKLRDELRQLESQKNATVDAEPSLRGREDDNTLYFGNPLEKHLCSLVSRIKAIKVELIKHGETLEPTPAKTERTTREEKDDSTFHPLDSNPDTAKRRAIVRQNLELPVQGLCTLLDTGKVPVPTGWVTRTWTQAFRSLQYRLKVQVIICKDKKLAR